MKRIISFTLITIFLFTTNIYAEKDVDLLKKGINISKNENIQKRFSPPKTLDERISWTTKSGGDLDDYICEESSRNPITFEIELPVDPNKLEEVKLTLSVYDIDYSEGEIDKVYINGYYAGDLHGANDSWSVNSFNINKNWLNGGTSENPGINEIKVHLTVEGWCCTVDWGSISAIGGNFRISEFSPGDKKTIKYLRSEINDLKIKFSDIPDMETINENTILLRYKNKLNQYIKVEMDYNQSVDEKVIYLEPKNDLMDGVKYWVSVKGGKNGVKNETGDTLEKQWTHFSISTIPDLTIDSMFTYQVTKYPFNDKNGNKVAGSDVAKLVKGKKTIIRIYTGRWKKKADVADDGQFTSYYAKFRLSDETGRVIVPNKKIKVLRADIMEATPNLKKLGENSINYISYWPIWLDAGGHTIKTSLEPYDQTSTDPKVFDTTRQISIAPYQRTIKMKYQFLKLDDWNDAGKFAQGKTRMNNLMNTCKQFFRANFPVTDIRLSLSPDIPIDTIGWNFVPRVPPVNGRYPYETFVLSKVKNHPSYTNKLANEYYVFLVPENFGTISGTQGYPSELTWTGTSYGNQLISLRDNGANASTIPHEFGHEFGLATEFPERDIQKHTPDDVKTEGYWVDKKKNKSFTEGNTDSDKLVSLMSKYINPVLDRWVWNVNYDKLYQAIAMVAPPGKIDRTLASYPLLNVNGAFDDNETCYLEPIWKKNSGEVLLEEEGDYTLALYNQAGAKVDEYSFKGFFVAERDGNEDTIRVFNMIIPKPQDFCTLKILKNTQELKTITCNAGKPTISITNPVNGANLYGTVNVSWDASDPEGDELVYQVLYSNDNGISWEGLAGDYRSTSIDINMDMLKPGENCIIKVLANDQHFNIVESQINCSYEAGLSVMYFDPYNYEDSVSVSTSVEAMFKTKVAEDEISQESMYLIEYSTGKYVNGRVEFLPETGTIRFIPDEALKFNTRYQATIKYGIKDVNGNELQNDVYWEFTTESDWMPFEVEQTIPDGSSLGVPVNTNVTIFFTQELDQSTITTSNITLKNLSNSQQISGSFDYSSEQKAVNFFPDAVLDYETDYQINVSNLVKSLSGQNLTQDYTFTFQTGKDTIQGISFTDVYEDYGKDNDGDGLYDYLVIEVEVDVISTGYYAINGQLTDTLNQEITWSSIGSQYLDRGIHRLTLQFDGKLINVYRKNGPYFLRNLQIYDTDNTDNNDWKELAYITNVYDYNQFQTNYTPVVLSFTPTDLSTDVPVNTKLTAVFSRPMQASTINTSSFYLRDKDGNYVNANVTYNETTLTATLDPMSNLIPEMPYTASILRTIQDTSYNYLLQQYNWGFTTSSSSSTDAITDVISYPNPFPHESMPSGSMKFTYVLNSSGGKVYIKIYSQSADLIMTLNDEYIPANAGYNEYEWDGNNQNYNPVASGTYHYIIIFIDADNEEHIATGSFTVIR